MQQRRHFIFAVTVYNTVSVNEGLRNFVVSTELLCRKAATSRKETGQNRDR